MSDIQNTRSTSGGLMMFLFSLLAGLLADKNGRKSIILWPRVAMLLVVTMMVTLLTGMTGVSSLVAIPEMMPIALRATGVSIIYAIGVIYLVVLRNLY
ncbi:MFS transporter [Snodgrassella gandavensis]|uniref:MFS transporter n=1 Tax=Snodgrassella gandavensis TaxID=2946698 RepID=UPI001EF72833|nr:MFS transporter [Snodgrassella gandavensis]